MTSARPAHTLQIALVTGYLLLVAAWLMVTRQVPAAGITRIVAARLRPPYAGRITAFEHDAGLGWIAPVPGRLLSDLEASSSLRLFENGEALGPAHAPHADVRSLGAGRYSHWGAHLYFSTSDGSDPQSNGRVYEVREVR